MPKSREHLQLLLLHQHTCQHSNIVKASSSCGANQSIIMEPPIPQPERARKERMCENAFDLWAPPNKTFKDSAFLNSDDAHSHHPTAALQPSLPPPPSPHVRAKTQPCLLTQTWFTQLHELTGKLIQNGAAVQPSISCGEQHTTALQLKPELG